MSNFKKLLTVLALMASGVISQPANAGDKTDIILGAIGGAIAASDRNDRYDRGDIGDRYDSNQARHEARERRGDRDYGYGYGHWVCRTQSRGYTFRAEGRSYDEANYNVVNMCMNHPYGYASECRFAVRCDQVGGGNGGGGNGGYYPPPREYTCQTHAQGQWYRASARRLERAQRQVLNECANYSGRPRQCERNLQCGY